MLLYLRQCFCHGWELPVEVPRPWPPPCSLTQPGGLPTSAVLLLAGLSPPTLMRVPVLTCAQPSPGFLPLLRSPLTPSPTSPQSAPRASLLQLLEGTASAARPASARGQPLLLLSPCLEQTQSPRQSSRAAPGGSCYHGSWLGDTISPRQGNTGQPGKQGSGHADCLRSPLTPPGTICPSVSRDQWVPSTDTGAHA